MTSCSPGGGAWRLGWTPVECGSAHPAGADSWSVWNVTSAGQVQLGHREAALDPSDPPTGHRDSSAVLTTSSPLSGSCQGNWVLGVGPQGQPDGWGNSDSSCLLFPATYLPEDHQGLTASSEGGCLAEHWVLLIPASAPVQRGRGTDCLGQVDGDQGQGRAHFHCTDCMVPAVPRRMQVHLLVVAAVAVVAVVHQGRDHCTLPHVALVEGNLLPQDACSSTQNTRNSRKFTLEQ